MADFAGKLLDIIGLIPIGKLAKLGKILDKLKDLKNAKKRVEALRQALRAADEVVNAARRALEQARRALDEALETARRARALAEKGYRETFEKTLKELPDGLSEVEEVRRATQAAEQAGA